MQYDGGFKILGNFNLADLDLLLNTDLRYLPPDTFLAYEPPPFPTVNFTYTVNERGEKYLIHQYKFHTDLLLDEINFLIKTLNASSIKKNNFVLHGKIWSRLNVGGWIKIIEIKKNKITTRSVKARHTNRDQMRCDTV